MGLMDKIKGLVGGHKKEISGGVDKAADVAKDKLPDQHDDKVDKAADTVKDQIDKLDGS
jgi:MT0933-like antitoxin protein